MASGTAASRASGLLKLAILAAVLGVHSGAAEAYNLANTTPNMVYDLVAGGILASWVVPIFVDRIRSKEPLQAERDISAVSTVAATVLVLVSVVFIIIAPWIVALYNVGTSGPGVVLQAHVATVLLRLFALQVVFYGAITLITAVLNAQGHFAIPGFAPTVNNLVVIVVLIVAGLGYHSRSLEAINGSLGLLLLLGVGTTAGVAAQMAVLVPSLKKARVGIKWHWDPRNPAVGTIIRLSGWTVGFVAANQVSNFVMLTLAHSIDTTGGATAWTYAYMFFQLPFGVIAVSVMSAYQPELAKLWTAQDIRAFRGRLSDGLRSTLVMTIPAAVGYVVLGDSIVRMVLAHGAAARSGTAGAGSLLVAMALGLPGFSAYLYLIRAWQSMQDTKTVFYLYAFENTLNIVLGLILFRPLGLFGLGLSLSIAYTVSAFVALSRLRVVGAKPPLGAVRPYLLRIGLPSAAMALTVILVRHFLRSTVPIEVVVVGVTCGVAVFGVSAVVGLRQHERLGERDVNSSSN